MKKLLIFLFLIFPVILSYSDHAPAGSWYQSGTLVPVNNEQIQMVSEKITINIVSYGKFSVRVDYNFLNTTNERQQILMGFPNIKVENGKGLIGNIQNFEFYSGKERLLVESIPSEFNESENWQDKELKEIPSQFLEKELLCSEVVFEPSESKKLSAQYTQNYGNLNSYMNYRFEPYFEYILKTGRYWKDEIIDIEIFINGFSQDISMPDQFTQYTIEPTFSIDANGQKFISNEKLKATLFSSNIGLSISPNEYKIINNGRTIYMHFRNIEPDFNIRIKPLINYTRMQRLLRDNLYETYLTLDNNKYINLELISLTSTDYRDGYDAYNNGCLLIDKFEIILKKDINIDRLFFSTLSLYKNDREYKNNLVFEFNNIKSVNNKITLSFARPIFASRLVLYPIFSGSNQMHISEIVFKPTTILESFVNGGIVNSNNLRLRESNDLNSKIIKMLPEKEIVTVLDVSPYRERIDDMFEHWFKVKTSNGDIGWIYGYFLDRNISNIVNYDKIYTMEEFRNMRRNRGENN